MRAVAEPALARGTERGVWTTPGEAALLCLCRASLRRTAPIALLVGTALSAINQGGVITGGDASLATWIRVGANYAIPFLVSNAGVLTATRESQEGEST